MEDPIVGLVRAVAKTSFRDLPEEVVYAVKRSIVDTLATTVAGSSALGAGTLADLVQTWGGRPEASVLVYGGKVPAPNAALVNATMARAVDLDDMHESGGGHLSATCVPAGFAIAEYGGRPIGGRQFITALALGSDVIARVRTASKSPSAGWTGQTFAPLGVVGICGKVLGFSEEQVLNGMGIAFNQCAGTVQSNVESTLATRFTQGFGAKAGVLSAVLAEKGITGPRNILTGKYGLYPMYYHTAPDWDILTEGLGRRFAIGDVSVKLYPCCKHTHIPIEATIQLLAEHGIAPDAIDEILVSTNSYGYTCAPEGPGDPKLDPRSPMDAQFSIPYTVGVAAVRGAVFLEDFLPAAMGDPAVRRIAAKVRVVVDPEKDKSGFLVSPCDVEIRTGDRTYRRQLAYVKGHPKNPATMGDCVDKLFRCMPFAVRPLKQAAVEEAVAMITALEDVTDVTAITELLSP